MQYKRSIFFLVICVVSILHYSIVFGSETIGTAHPLKQNTLVKQWPSEVEVDPVKKWTIKFNMKLYENSIWNAVEVRNSSGNKINTELSLSNDEKSIIVKSPEGGYNDGETYYLNVSKNLKSKAKMLPLNEEIQMKFTIQSTNREGWKLLWNDEFSGKDGAAVDFRKWRYNVGGDGWGNKELGYYTDRIENSFQEDGKLVLRALKEDYGGSKYTSARLLTNGKIEQTYGRFEARIKIAGGQGFWPAFWMLSTDESSPETPEIDIMENVGNEPDVIYSSLHGPGYYGHGMSFSKGFSLPNKEEFSKDYHVYAIEWDENSIRYFVDDCNYYTVTKSDLSKDSIWAFNKPFYMILNLAVGGDWPGSPDSTTVFPQNMYIDYVRVYNR